MPQPHQTIRERENAKMAIKSSQVTQNTYCLICISHDKQRNKILVKYFSHLIEKLRGKLQTLEETDEGYKFSKHN